MSVLSKPWFQKRRRDPKDGGWKCEWDSNKSTDFHAWITNIHTGEIIDPSRDLDEMKECCRGCGLDYNRPVYHTWSNQEHYLERSIGHMPVIIRHQKLQDYVDAMDSVRDCCWDIDTYEYQKCNLNCVKWMEKHDPDWHNHTPVIGSFGFKKQRSNQDFWIWG